jgi:hypothetical protein
MELIPSKNRLLMYENFEVRHLEKKEGHM